jgi:WS/DGAT/MGAT family acyltransferase
MPSDPLTPLDASFLHVEDATGNPMHVGSVLVFAGDAPAYEDFLAQVEDRLGLVPRYRQRIATVPLGQGRPRWVDDEDFDLRYHVRTTGLPGTRGDAELRTLAGRVFSRALRRDRPLWEMWLVDGLAPAQAGGPERFAVISKTHHAMVDGISGLDVLSAIFAPDEEAGADGWQPRRTPSGIELLAESLVERALSPRELLRPVRAALRGPRRFAEDVGTRLVGIGALAWAGRRPAPRTPYNRGLAGPDRRVAFYSVALDDLKAIKNELGGTLNDTVLTIVARALRRDLGRRGEDLSELNAFVPVSVAQSRNRAAAPGNEVAGMVVRLPIGCPDPVECLRRISAETREVKESGQALGAQALTELGGLTPPTILSVAARLSARQRFVNLVVTNVPGPQRPLYLQGRELLEIAPMVPVGNNLALTVGAVSYNGTVSFGLVGDFDALPDLDVTIEDVRTATEELAVAAGVELRPAAEPEPSASAESKPDAPAADGLARDGEPAPAEPAAAAAEAAAEDAPDQPARPDDELVAESADAGAADGAGPELHVDEPWENYRAMTAREIADRLEAASPEEVAVVRLYENSHRRRRDVLRAAERALASR